MLPIMGKARTIHDAVFLEELLEKVGSGDPNLAVLTDINAKIEIRFADNEAHLKKLKESGYAGLTVTHVQMKANVEFPGTAQDELIVLFCTQKGTNTLSLRSVSNPKKEICLAHNDE